MYRAKCITHSWGPQFTKSAPAPLQTEKIFQTGEDMLINYDVMSATQAESYSNLKQQSLAVGKWMNLR